MREDPLATLPDPADAFTAVEIGTYEAWDAPLPRRPEAGTR